MTMDNPELQQSLAKLRVDGWQISHERPTRDLDTGKETNLWALKKWQTGEKRSMTTEQLVEFAGGKK